MKSSEPDGFTVNSTKHLKMNNNIDASQTLLKVEEEETHSVRPITPISNFNVESWLQHRRLPVPTPPQAAALIGLGMCISNKFRGDTDASGPHLKNYYFVMISQKV